MTHTGRVQIATQGNSHMLDITEAVAQEVGEGTVRDGMVVLFVIGSTAGLTTTEAEPGLLTHDLAAFYERIAPADQYYKHEATWHDDNGHSHVRASALGPSLTIPLVDGRLTLGTWQQIVLIDFDTRPRQREVVVQVVGE
jgi:secondary thiamine-phosphate synthase enzyme